MRPHAWDWRAHSGYGFERVRRTYAIWKRWRVVFDEGDLTHEMRLYAGRWSASVTRSRGRKGEL